MHTSACKFALVVEHVCMRVYDSVSVGDWPLLYVRFSAGTQQCPVIDDYARIIKSLITS